MDEEEVDGTGDEPAAQPAEEAPDEPVKEAPADEAAAAGPTRDLPPIQRDSNRGPAIIVALLIGAAVLYYALQYDFRPHHKVEFDHWVTMCANEHPEEICQEYGWAQMAYCYALSDGKPIGPHLIPERGVVTLYRGEFARDRFYHCLDLAVDYGLALRAKGIKVPTQ